MFYACSLFNCIIESIGTLFSQTIAQLDLNVNYFRAPFHQGDITAHCNTSLVSQRVTINHTIDINCSSMANRVLRKLVINHNPS